MIELEAIYNKIKISGEDWLISINKSGQVLKAKAKTRLASEVVRKHIDSVFGVYNDQLKSIDLLIEDLEYCGVYIVGKDK